MFGDRSIGHALMEQNERMRGRHSGTMAKELWMVLMYYTIYTALWRRRRSCTSCGNLIRVWHFRQIGGNLKVLLSPSSFDGRHLCLENARPPPTGIAVFLTVPPKVSYFDQPMFPIVLFSFLFTQLHGHARDILSSFAGNK